MAETTFAEGDVVLLKSGGPKMTVQSPSKDGGPIQCSWFDGGELRTGNFRPAMLLPSASLERLLPQLQPVKITESKDAKR